MSNPLCKLVLASASPRRRALLCEMGVEFEVYSANIDEGRHEEEAPEDFVTRLAREKAHQAALDLGVFTTGQRHDGNASGDAENPQERVAILSADTIVVQGDRVFGKPSDFDHAKRMWSALSANRHQVMTAVCLLLDGKNQVRLSTTEVEFGRVTEDQMQRYWDTGEPHDKAGGYAIQGFASAWVKQISGSYSSVVGLPLREVNQMLTEIKLNWL